MAPRPISACGLRFLDGTGLRAYTRTHFGARVRARAHAVKRETGCPPAMDRVNLCCPRNGKRNVVLTAVLKQSISIAEPASMSTRKAASAYHHWARNPSPGKGKRRFRQPGYRPDNEGRTPRGCGAAFTTSFPLSVFCCRGNAV